MAATLVGVLPEDRLTPRLSTRMTAGDGAGAELGLSLFTDF